jgi:phenylacetaldehyde dehydrogenase
VIGRVAFGTPGDVAAAVDTAAKAQPGWAALDDQERCAALMRTADAIDAHAEELAYVVSREQGKTMNGLGARYEAAGCAAWVRAAASTPLPVEVLVDDGQSRAGVLTAVTGAGDVGDALVRDLRVGKVMFTGSVKTGMKVIEASAGNMPRLTLELGGNDAAIVLPDVDPQAIAEGLFWGRIHQQRPDLCRDEAAVRAGRHLRRGRGRARRPRGQDPDGRRPRRGNVLGPLQNQMQWNVVNRLVEDAKVRGARVVMGGDPDAAAPGYFYPKTLIADIDNAAPLVQEEQFGPALPIIRYTDLEQAVEWANGVDVGLGASVWSADRDTALAIAARLQAGTVWINSHGGIDPRVPFGGAKRSGYGLEFGVEGLKAVSVPQVISG